MAPANLRHINALNNNNNNNIKEKEPLGLSRSDEKRPDGLSLVPWEAGKPLTWDVTVIFCPLADSYVAAAAREAGSAAEEAATCKVCEIFKHPGTSHIPANFR